MLIQNQDTPQQNDGLARGGLEGVLIAERDRLLRFLRLRGAGDDAEDLLQDLWQKILVTEQRPVAEPLAYLLRSAENLMRDRQRSERSRERRQHEWHHAALPEHDVPPGEHGLIARDRLHEAEAMLGALGTRVCAVFRHCRLDGVPQAVIAREMGLSLSTIEKDLQKAYRALARLREKFDAE